MKEQTLDELWKGLDTKGRTELLGLVADQLFIGADAFTAWRRRYRKIPQGKQSKLAAIIERKFNIKLKIA